MKSKKEICLENNSKGYWSGLNGLEIKHFEYWIDDYVYFTTNTWYSSKGVWYHRAKLEYNKGGEGYFRCNGYRIYLRDCIRI